MIGIINFEFEPDNKYWFNKYDIILAVKSR